MCNRFIQKGRLVKPGERARVLMKGPGAVFELSFDDAVFGGPAKSESRNYWIKREGAEPVIVPDIERFGEKNKTTSKQGSARQRNGKASTDSLSIACSPGKTLTAGHTRQHGAGTCSQSGAGPEGRAKRGLVVAARAGEAEPARALALSQNGDDCEQVAGAALLAKEDYLVSFFRSSILYDIYCTLL